MIDRLIAVPTVSRDSNLGVIEIARDHLASLGCRPHLVYDSTKKKANLFCTLADDAAAARTRGIVLSGHTDVVPVDGQDWASDPFKAAYREGRIHGRGTADMKGFIAIALAWAPKFLAAQASLPVHLSLTFDAEHSALVFSANWLRTRLPPVDADLERLLRVGDLLPAGSAKLWPELASRWTEARQLFGKIQEAAERAFMILNSRFQDFYRMNYTKWLDRADIPVIFTHQFLPRLLKAHWDPQRGPKAVVLVFDGLRTDAWDEFLAPVLEERYELVASYPGSAILPTETELSRKAISAGKMPLAFQNGSKRELDLLKAWLKDAAL